MEIFLTETQETHKGLKVLTSSAKLPSVRNAGYGSFIFTQDVKFSTDFSFTVEPRYENLEKKRYASELVFVKFGKSYKVVDISKNDFTGLHIGV